MYPYRSWLEEHLQQVTVHWSWRGGAGIEWAEEQVGRTGSYNLVVLMIGGNDLENWCSPYQLADRMEHLANRMIATGTQAWRNFDGVHFLYHGYRLAMRYLISLVVWIIHHNLW